MSITLSRRGVAAEAPAPSLAMGLIVWVFAFALLPAPLAARVLLLAPLVIVPRFLAAIPARPWVARLAGWPALLAAVPLVVAFGLQPGWLPTVFALPWLAVASVAGLAGVRDGLTRLPSILSPRNLPDLGVDAALVFWAVGAAFIVLERLGVSTGFAPAIVLLTATHFHFAGFGLLGLASLCASTRPWLRASVLGLLIGIPVTALGFVTGVDAINSIGALLVGLSGLGVALALLTSPVGTARWVSRVAGTALLVGMPMGIAWSLATLTRTPFVDLDTMIRTHGELNAVAVLLAALTQPSASA